ncbi:hypothetical protein HYH02_001241 [Chlamydomonas schloesseri]|uniref:Lon N-terminal domain-containing protein n=1 Tax=Chlamydomonas schloesseri TaxID=2026947 RepID=A0A836BC73_9CHLO|nr:hypothetical protein HYH02_001241 [Chlamydomonas schloesseri]|eukprot:KAG2454207.1 hypothetical protein HYH02_001241 [Chlamydomonas schloesseri]
MQVQSEAAASTVSTTPEVAGVVRVREGDVTVAATTVTFGARTATEASTAAAEYTAAAAQDAVKVALLALRGALGVEGPPSAVVALTSLRLPRGAAAAALAALRQELGPDTPLLGCSSRLRLPDERRSLGLTDPPSRAVPPSAEQSSSGSGSGSSTEAAASTSASPSPPGHSSVWPDAAAAASAAASAVEPFHVTLAAAHTLHHEAHVLHCETSSLPRLPHLAEALRGARPPSFLMLTAADGLGAELLGRLENLFPGSCVGAGVAAQQSARDRRLLLVGGPGRDGGGGSGGGSSSGSAAAAGGGGSGVAATRGRGLSAVETAAAEAGVGMSVSEAATRGAAAAGAANSGSSRSAGGSGGGGGGGRRSGRGIPAAEFEGPFQRMLLNRDGSGTSADSSAAGSDDVSRPSAIGGDDDSVSGSSSGSSSSSGRRRKPPATAAAQAEVKAALQKRGAAAAAAAASSDLDSDSDDENEAGSSTLEGEDAAAAAVAARLQALLPPYVAVGNQLHTGGAVLLAFYPRSGPPAAAATATAPAAAGTPAATAAGRLAAAACDSLARVALGTDHLQHVALRGAALSAISPPATGLEPYSPLPAAPDNPYYWWPADPAPPHHQQLEPQLQPHWADPSPPPDGPAAAVTTAAAASDGAVGAVGAAAAVAAAAHRQGAAEQGDGGEGEGEGEGEGDGEEVPSARALSALSEGLVGLPLFPLEGAILFPGQTMQLRVFEKRYRLLMKAAMDQGAAFGLCWRGTGTTAVVRSYQCPEGGAGDVLVLLEGGVRFSYSPADLDVLPASYGLNVARRAEYLVDDPPPGPEDAAAMVAAARQLLDGVAGALEAATSPSAQRTARSFANALHFASSGSGSSEAGGSSIPAPSKPAAAAAAPITRRTPGPTPPQPKAAEAPGGGVAGAEAGQPAAGQVAAAAAAAGQATGGDGAGGEKEEPEDEEALLAADVAAAKAALDVETASLLSLYLAPHIPVHLEGLRREWYTTRSALWRLQQEAAWLRGNSRVCMAVASSVLRLPREHPLRLMLGLGRVSPVT